MPIRSCLLLCALLGACAAEPPVPAPTPHARFDPAPMPFVHAGRPGTVGALEMPIPPKMPLGTGAVPVSGGVARGAVVSGFKTNF